MLDRESDGPLGGGTDVRLLRVVTCMRCGAETPGPATCVACLQALDELRALATDPRTSRDPVRWSSDRIADLR